MPAAHNGAVVARALARVGVAGACAAGIVASLITYRSEARLQESFRSAVAGRPPAEIVDLLDSSRPLNPDSARETGGAAFLLRHGQPQRAEQWLRRALRSEPENARVWLTLARLQVARGQDAAAHRSYERARQLDSQLPSVDLPPPL